MFLDSNTLDPRTALVLSVIASDTNTDGEVIDTQGVRDINIVTTLQTLVSGDMLLQIRTADNAGMSTNVEVIAAAKINGNLYNSVILNAALAAGQKYHHHIQRTSHRRFVQLRVVSSNTASYTLTSEADLGTLSKTVDKDKNPIT